jgi:hypothetical protein
MGKGRAQKKDPGLEVLLDLNGSEYHFNSGYWIKIKAWKIKTSKNQPHGIRYSLTLHDRNNTRIIGFDNAHAPKYKPKRKKYRLASSPGITNIKAKKCLLMSLNLQKN